MTFAKLDLSATRETKPTKKTHVQIHDIGKKVLGGPTSEERESGAAINEYSKMLWRTDNDFSRTEVPFSDNEDSNILVRLKKELLAQLTSRRRLISAVIKNVS